MPFWRRKSKSEKTAEAEEKARKAAESQSHNNESIASQPQNEPMMASLSNPLPKSDYKPRGILKNKDDPSDFAADSYPTSDDLDESLRNAQKNCALNRELPTQPVTNPQKTSAEDGGDGTESRPHTPPLMDDSVAIASADLDMKTNDDNNNTATDATTEADANADTNTNTDTGVNATTDAVITEEDKAVIWDEDNLAQNEAEKVPRMKIDEPDTPFHPMPEELQDNTHPPLPPSSDASEEILDVDPMEMSLDSSDRVSGQHPIAVENSPHFTAISADQNQQSMLLADDGFREKMISDAMERRDDIQQQQQQQTTSEPPPTHSAWEQHSDHESVLQRPFDFEWSTAQYDKCAIEIIIELFITLPMDTIHSILLSNPVKALLIQIRGNISTIDGIKNGLNLDSESRAIICDFLDNEFAQL